MHESFPRSDPLRRVEHQTLVEEVDEAEKHLELVVLHLVLSVGGGEESSFEISSFEGGEDLARVLLDEKEESEEGNRVWSVELKRV